MGFCSNDSLVDSVDLETCSGYHVAAFSFAFRCFRFGASLTAVRYSPKASTGAQETE